ncbi:DUF4231 domain-containing protein [uncultured Kriegella sp.]|uniref:DUF4231 domain-containing protein n=1 Tax=uncultured Kriegella sp. TaxID=1798910 RepID=UPI0030DDB2D2|tara:strand:+ start:30217 stop:30633 length:417 start_codon:yes stop_codon:yes gene_type:complete
MKAEEYVTERLDAQQKWYSKKSGINKDYHNRIKIATIICAVLIPLLSGLESFGMLAGALGAVVAILTSVSGVMKFEQKWINYRTASERLKREKLLWQTKTPPYEKDNAFTLLVTRVETIINVENGDWGDYIASKEKPE